jgi:Holliday junction resolvase RusA-like endonuclease
MGEAQPMGGPLCVTVVAIFPIPESWSKRKKDDARRGMIVPGVRPDWENLAKTLDALNGVVWIDDKQVVDGRVLKQYGDRPRLSIEVEEYVAPVFEQQEAA